METIVEFEEALREDMEALFGSCEKKGNVLRSMGNMLGVTGSSVIFEAAFEAGLNPGDDYPVLHFHTTLAQKIDDAIVPGILQGLNELNNVISVGAFPAFGSFGYYGPLRQVYLTYRMPLNETVLDAERDNVRYYLGSLYEQLDIFVDYVLFLCNDPKRISLDQYMAYLDTIADLNDLEARVDALDKYVSEMEKEAEETD